MFRTRVTIGSGAGFKHLETFEIGDGVFIGAQSYLQGRFDGSFVIGESRWMGPQSFFDGRDLVLGGHVGWGPGAKVLGSQHTGQPIDVPMIQTDLEMKPVRVEAWADIGTNATLLPGVTVGKGSIVGAGAVVERRRRRLTPSWLECRRGLSAGATATGRARKKEHGTSR